MLPEGWKEYTGIDITSKITKGSSPKWQGFEYQDAGTLFVTSENVRDGYLDVSSPKFLPIEFNQKLKNSQLQYGDILINIVGASIGRSCQYLLSQQQANINQAVCLFRTNDIVNSDYIKYFFQLPSTIKRLLGTQSDSARPNLSLTDMRDFVFITPPLPEQKKIAQILSTWDNAISATERLLENSQLRKKALMQQLLTGKKRLPGFEGEWKSGSLKDIASISKGKALSSKDLIEGDYPVIAGGKTSPYCHREFTHENVITVSASGAYAGYVALHPYKFWASDCSVVEAKKFSDINFIYYFMVLKQSRIYSLQSGGAQPHIYPKDLHVLHIDIPDKDEQQAIANVLTTADQEIDALQKRLDHLKQEKKALMQQLLTGKRRVQVDDAA